MEKLSPRQESVLRKAADGLPVYVESFSFSDSGPQGRTFFGTGEMTTFRSLVKRGLLKDNNKAGYEITPLGLRILGGK